MVTAGASSFCDRFNRQLRRADTVSAPEITLVHGGGAHTHTHKHIIDSEVVQTVQQKMKEDRVFAVSEGWMFEGSDGEEKSLPSLCLILVPGTPPGLDTISKQPCYCKGQ